MLNRTGDSQASRHERAMRRLLPFAALSLMVGTLAAPLVDVGTCLGQAPSSPEAGPVATTSAATGRHWHRGDPQRHGQCGGDTRQRSPTATAPRTRLANCTGTVTTVNGSTTPLTGSTTTAETATLSRTRRSTRPYYFNIKAAGKRRHLLWQRKRVSRPPCSPLATTERGQRDHGHRLDAQRLGQRGELIDHGELLLQHYQPPRIACGAELYSPRSPHWSSGRRPRRSSGPASRPQLSATFTVPAQTPSPVTAGRRPASRDHHHGL